MPSEEIPSVTSRRALVADALTIIRDRYIFPETATKIADAIGVRADAGEYDALSEEELGTRITDQFHDLSGDKHLRLRVRAPHLQVATSEAEEEAAWLEEQRLANFRIAAVQRLDGNVGYVDLRGIASADAAGPAVAAPVGVGGPAQGPV